MLPIEITQLGVVASYVILVCPLRPPPSEFEFWVGLAQDSRNIITNRPSLMLPIEGTQLA